MDGGDSNIVSGLEAQILESPEFIHPADIAAAAATSLDHQEIVVMATQLDTSPSPPPPSQQPIIVPETLDPEPPTILTTQIVETPMVAESVVVSTQFEPSDPVMHSSQIIIPTETGSMLPQIVETPMVAESVVVSTTEEPSPYPQADSTIQSIVSQTPITVQVSSQALETVVNNQTLLTTPTTTILPADGGSTTDMQMSANPTIGQLPMKISGGSHSILVANPVIGGSTIGNQLATFSYIIPGNSFSPNKPQSTIISNAPISDMATTTLINTGSTIIADPQRNSPAPGVKLIQPSNQTRHLVFSPLKTNPTTLAPMVAVPAATKQDEISIGKSLNDMMISVPSSSKAQTGYSGPATAAIMTTTGADGNQQPQLIFLSPMKANVAPANQTSKSATATSATFIPSFKFLPNPKLPTLAPSPSPSKRMIAPAPPSAAKSILAQPPTTRPIQPNASKSGVQYISLVSMPNEINAAITSASSSTKTIGSTGKPKTKGSAGTTKPNMVQVNPSAVGTETLANEPMSATSNESSKGKTSQPTSIWMLPKQILKMDESSSTSTTGSKLLPKYVPIAPNPIQANAILHEVPKSTITNANSSGKTLVEGTFEENRRKACNCTRSQCLKLYCDCFANGEFCSNCNCVRCFNNLEHEETRQKAIRLCLERNPNAFHPKIGQTRSGEVERRHNKGCCCKRSGCLKNYCECYEAKIPCSSRCKCMGCRNVEENAEQKFSTPVEDPVTDPQIDMPIRCPPPAVAAKMNLWGPDIKPKLPIKVRSDCPPFNILTNEILEATAGCLLAQAEEGEFENLTEENVEGLILDQFGECLSQILNLANNGISDDFDISEDDDTINTEENNGH